MKSTPARSIFIAYFLIVALLSIFSLDTSTRNNILGTFETKAYSETGDAAQFNYSVLGLQKIASDEVAVVKKSIDKPTGKKVTQAIQLKNGKTVTVESDQNTVYSVIESGGGGANYIKASEDTQVFKVDAIDNKTDEKIEPELARKLKKEAVAPVIVRVKVPYARFYERKQSPEQAATKRGQFENAKSNVLKNFSAKSKHKKDLEIVAGFAADVDQETLAKLEKDPNVLKVEFDQPVQATLDTSLDQIGVKETWSLVDSAGSPLTGRGKRIAILDTGVDYTHPDLGGCLGATCKVTGGYDFINNDTNPMDDHGHGTHVAATAAGRGVLNGVAPDASIIAVKVLSAGGSGSSSQIVAGINYATDPNRDGNPDDHVDVASMSLGGSGNPDDAMSVAVDNSTAAGVTYTIAAGNSGPSASTINSPGTARNAITVAASCKTSQIGSDSRCSGPIASFSSRGPLVYNGVDIQKPDVAAPGVMICAARWGISFGTAPTCIDSFRVRISGTSMATPHVAGLAALVLQANPSYTPSQVKQTLKSTAKNLNVSTNDQGAGEIDAKKAIPQVAKFAASPSTWTLSSNPTNKLSIHQQTFSVSATDASINTLDISLDGPAGVSLTPSKPTLQVANGQTDSFDATFTIDNDTVKAGTYLVRIVLSENGSAKGSIPVFLTVKPTFTTSAQNIDYGIDNPSLSNWESDTKTITVTNLRTDEAQTLTIGYSPYPAGITLQTPSSVSIPASGSATIDTKIVVDNTKIANNIYTGTLNLFGPSTSVKVNTKFVKYYVLTVQDPNTNDLVSSWVTVHNRNGTSFADYTGSTPRVFYLNSQGTYDVIVEYFSLFDPTSGKYRKFDVVKEGVNVQGGSTIVNVNKSDAKNLLKVVPTDPSGNPARLNNSTERLRYLPQKYCCTSSMTWMISGDGTDYLGNKYVSNLGSNYRYEKMMGTAMQPAIELQYYYIGSTGLSDHLTVTNTPSDFRTMKVEWDLDQQAGNIQPLLWSALGFGGSVSYYTNVFLPLPLTQTIYAVSSMGDAAHFFAQPVNNGYFYSVDTSATFTVGDSPKRWPRQTRWSAELPAFKENTVFQGLGPSFWQGMFANTSSYVRLMSYFDYTDCNSTGDCAMFFRQDYGRKPYTGATYSLYKNDVLMTSGSLPDYPRGPAIADILTSSGKYEYRAELPYKNKNLAMTGKVRAMFNTALADPNPPSIKRLHIYSGGNRSEQYEPSLVNRVEFEMDPVGGTLTNATASYATDGVNFNNLTVSNNNGVYSASIAPFSDASKVSVRISGTDNAGNNLTYTFELPVGSGTPIADTEAPTVSIKSPANGADVAGVVNVTTDTRDNFGVAKAELYINGDLYQTTDTDPFSFQWNATNAAPGSYTLLVKAYDPAGNIGESVPVNVDIKDTLSPTTSITSPAAGQILSGTVNISASASDNTGVTKVELYVNGALKDIKTDSPYTFSWDTNAVADGQYILTTKVYDAAGNVGSSQPVAVTVKDATAPTVTITSPLNGATLSRRVSVTIAANAADNKGVARVEFLADNKPLCTDTGAPYSCSWTTPNRRGAVTISARVYDAAGNTTSQNITVNVK